MTGWEQRVEFGDFQTPEDLAARCCRRLSELGMRPDVIVEPTCGTGAFVVAAANEFPEAREILGFEINGSYLDTLRSRLARSPHCRRVRLGQTDFFDTDWNDRLRKVEGSLLVVGNFPWVTNAAQGLIGGSNLPEKTNFQNHRGFDAITGKANFDISEWMLLEVLRWFRERRGDVAMLVKTAVARKVLAQARAQRVGVNDALMIRIDAKREFGASVDACLLVMRVSPGCVAPPREYSVYASLSDTQGRQVGHRSGLMVADLASFDACSHLLGRSPIKWRSGVKHDAAQVMELSLSDQGLRNGLGEAVGIEPTYVFPLMKGSDVGSDKGWRGKYVVVPQRYVGESTAGIETTAPVTWAYLQRHASALDARGSTIYARNPRFSVFGVGEYAFRPWRIAVCALYKSLRFRLVGPIAGRPVMFDDTVYYVSFETEQEARAVLDKLNSDLALTFLGSLIFWDEKRPIKTSILNALDWSRIQSPLQTARPASWPASPLPLVSRLGSER
jgi:hypothetical protein